MNSSNLNKFLFISLFASMFISSCNFWQSQSGEKDLQNSGSTIQNNIPFSNKEPENFQADLIITTFINGEKTVRKTALAKVDGKSLQTFNAGSENARSVISSANKTFLVDHGSKNYRELSSDKADAFSDDTLIKNLTSKWLNEKRSAGFEKIGAENELIKYLVKIENGERSEIIIYVDEKLELPVKQEFYSISEGKKALNYSVEIKDFRTEVDETLFDLPNGYEEIN